MRIHRLRNLEQWQSHAERIGTEFLQWQALQNQYETRLRTSKAKPTLRGFSFPAGRQVDFLVDLDQSPILWRETLTCPETGLINRIRASLHAFENECEPYIDDPIYLMEQVTPTYRWLAARYPNVIGSEFLGEHLEPGTVIDGVRHEDATRLSFDDQSLACVLSFEVFEHVPNYAAAFAECYRVLRPGGYLLWTVPFVLNQQHTLVRARINSKGQIEHLLEPEYHGNPVHRKGSLCFYHFGWDMLDTVREAGFSDAWAMLFWSEAFAYLGEEALVFIARR